MKEYPEIYRRTLSEARQGGENEISNYKNSLNENISCAKDIEKIIREKFDGMHLAMSNASEIIDKYGIDRVLYVLANTVQQKDYDGRFSLDNKEWANSIPVVNDGDRNYKFVINSHPVIVNELCNMVREHTKSHLFDNSMCEEKTGMDFTGKIAAIYPEVLKEEYRKPEYQLFYCKGGFGCSPFTRGRKIFGEFLYDGEKTHFNREDFIGIVKAEFIPEWAREKAKTIDVKPSVKQKLENAQKSRSTINKNKNLEKEEI